MSRMDLERVTLAHLEDNTDELASEIVREELEQDGNPEDVLESSENRLSDKGKNSVKNMVTRSIENQFGSNYAFLRELVQNGRDAYRDKEGEARVEIDYQSGDTERSVTARDFGEGMSPEDVVSNLLVPMQSDKIEDLNSVGEHGVGWFSTVDAGDVVRVTTGDQENDLKSTVWIVEDSEGQRKVNMNVSKDAFEGTEVEVMDFGRTFVGQNLKEKKVKENLGDLVGHANPEKFGFFFNGEKLNQQAAEFSKGSVGITDQGSATLYFNQTDENFSPSVITQEGLKIKDLRYGDYSDFSDIKRKIIRSLDDNFELRVNYSNDFSLDKGRTDFASSDQEAAQSALEDAVDQFYMERVLDDEELLRELDLDVTDELEQMFTDVYEQINDSDNEERGAEMDSYGQDEFTPNFGDDQPLLQEIRTVGVKDWLKDRIPSRFKDEEIDVEELLRNIERKKAKGVSFDDENFGYKKEIFTKECIPAEKNGEPHRVSLGDILKLYSEEGMNSEDGEVILGDVKVSENHPLTSKAFEKINEIEAEKQNYQILSNLKEESQELYKTASEYLFGAQEGTDFVLERTSYDTLEDTVGDQSEGEAYLDFLQITNYINDFMEEALELESDTEVMVHYDPRDEYSNNRDLAHTNNRDISFNLAGAVSDFVGEMEDGFNDEEEYREFVEKIEHVIYHERAHIEHDDDGKAAHGDSFWDTKQDLRKNVREYAIRNGRDMYAEIADQTNVFEGYDHLSARELGGQIEANNQGLLGYVKSKHPI